MMQELEINGEKKWVQNVEIFGDMLIANNIISGKKEIVLCIKGDSLLEATYQILLNALIELRKEGFRFTLCVTVPKLIHHIFEESSLKQEMEKRMLFFNEDSEDKEYPFEEIIQISALMKERVIFKKRNKIVGGTTRDIIDNLKDIF